MSDPITFSNKTALKFLEENGFVATFRSSRRTTPFGKAWVRKERGAEKEFDVFTVEVGTVEFGEDEKLLRELAAVSGFQTRLSWKQAIRQHIGKPDDGFVYLVIRWKE